MLRSCVCGREDEDQGAQVVIEVADEGRFGVRELISPAAETGTHSYLKQRVELDGVGSC